MVQLPHPELAEVKSLRKKHGLTQSELAGMAGVSQSLVAKIEAGSVDPTFSHAKRIFEVLHSIEREKGPKAGELITSRIIAVARSDSVTEAIRKMRANSISQLPVMEGGSVVGLVSESAIIEKVAQGESPNNLKAGGVMEEAPPVVVRSTPLSAVAELLRHFPLVIVSEKGKPVGVITKSDVLRNI